MSYEGTGAIIGVGSILAFSTAQGGSYTALKELVKIPFPHAPVGKVDATNMESENATEEYIPGFSAPAELTFEANYLASDMVIYQANLRVAQWWKATLPDGSVFTFPGYLADVDGEADPKVKIPTKGKLQVTGPIVFAPGS